MPAKNVRPSRRNKERRNVCRVAGSVRILLHVSKKRGKFLGTIVRSCHPNALDAMCGPSGLVADLNGRTACA
jgi:hypothetical protein